MVQRHHLASHLPQHLCITTQSRFLATTAEHSAVASDAFLMQKHGTDSAGPFKLAGQDWTLVSGMLKVYIAATSFLEECVPCRQAYVPSTRGRRKWQHLK
jgi:hypothetical protein